MYHLCMHHSKYLEEGKLQCELCKNLTPERNVYVCESGHTICISCDDSSSLPENNILNKKCHDCIDIQNEGGDDINEKAGGDNFKIKSKIGETRAKHHFHSTQNKETNKRNPVQNDSGSDNSFETMIDYKNMNYDTNGSTIITFLEKKFSKDKIAEKISVRPVVCPILNCHKTVAMDAILKHFSFDHSKIATLPLSIGKSLKIYLKLSNLSSSTQCLAIINTVGSIGDCSSRNNLPLLLMGAKIVNACPKNFEDKYLSENETCSQVEPRNNTINLYHKKEIKDCLNFEEKQTDKDVILWICWLTDNKHVCSITVRRKHILSYNYVGEGLHLQNKQDPLSVSQSPECLIVRRHSIPKLLDNHTQIHVNVKVLE